MKRVDLRGRASPAAFILEGQRGVLVSPHHPINDWRNVRFVIDCLLKTQQEGHMEEVIRQSILKALAGITLQVSAYSEDPSQPQSTENISDLPQALLFAMDDI
jgi:hypothetical protein